MNLARVTSLAAGSLLLWRVLEREGLEARAIFLEAGLNPDAVRDPHARYAVTQVIRLWELAIEATGDPGLGLKLAQHWHPSALQALGFAWMASRSLRDAFNRLARYWHVVVHLDLLTAVETEEGLVVSVYQPPEVLADLHAVYDSYLAVLVAMCRAIAGADLNPRRVRLQHAQPPHSGEYFELFRCPVEFGAKTNALVIGAETLDLELPTSNAEIARVSDEIIVGYLAGLDKGDVVYQVRARLLELLPSGCCSSADVARALNMSPRTLQRRLRAAGTSFNELVLDTRSELAKQYVGESHRTISEVAYSLGFSEVSNFSRAFRRWTGVSPSQYRSAAP